MKSTRWSILVVCLVALFAGSALGQSRGRKLPLGTYIKSAKIEINGDRYESAAAFLDSLFMHYGPHGEALWLMAQIHVDNINNTGDLKEKVPYLEKFVAYKDTLHMTCGNEDVKKKYRKNCDQYAAELDSTAVLFWRQFYNAAVEQLGEIRTTTEDMKADPDSASQEFYQTKRDAYVDSCEMNMALSILIDSTDYRAYVGLASMSEEKEDFVKANERLEKALAYVPDEDRSQILLKLTYNFFKNNQYCESIPFLKEYCNLVPSDVDNMYNLSSVFNRCEQYDESLRYYERILEVDSAHVDALVGVARFYNQQAIDAQDSIRTCQDVGDEACVAAMQEARKEAFRSAKGYFERGFAVDPENIDVASELGLISFILEDYEQAIIAFEMLTKTEPEETEYWTSLGDCYLRTQQFDKSARAYEKVVELSPERKDIWESLEMLYVELKENDNLANAREHLK